VVVRGVAGLWDPWARSVEPGYRGGNRGGNRGRRGGRFLLLMVAIGCMFLKQVTARLLVRNALLSDGRAMEDLQRRVFPTLSAAELLTEEHFCRLIEIFPEGQLVIVHGTQLIASTSTLRCRYPSTNHTFLGITGNLFIDTHDPMGEWLYGLDMGVDPALQGLGLGRYLYAARHEIAKSLNMRGQVIVGMPSGYGAVNDSLPFDEYYSRLLRGEIFDPIVSVQMKMGFEPEAVIANYLEDPKCGNYGVMMKLAVEKIVTAPTLTPCELETRIAQKFTPQDAGLGVVVERSGSGEPTTS